MDAVLPLPGVLGRPGEAIRYQKILDKLKNKRNPNRPVRRVKALYQAVEFRRYKESEIGPPEKNVDNDGQ
jgi:hypothetical protein